MAAFDPRPGMALDALRVRLVHAMTAYDRKMSARSRYWNPHALPLMLEAIDRAAAEAEGGTEDDFIEAVMANLNPAPWLRTWLRKLDPTIDVRRQRWVRDGQERW